MIEALSIMSGVHLMFLRLMLVGAVATLGFQPPSRGDMARMVQSGRAWWDAQVAALVLPMPDGATAFAAEPTPEPKPATMPDGLMAFAAERPTPSVAMPDDLTAFVSEETEVAQDGAFATVVERMTGEFTAATAEPIAPEGPIPAVDLYPGLAYQMNRDAEGLDLTIAVAPPAVASTELVVESKPSAEPRKARFSDALRLTGEAVRAWVGVLNAPAVMSARY